MKRDEETYRLAEDNAMLGLEGRITKGKYINFHDLAVYDHIADEEYPYEVTLDPGHRHSGTYRFDNDYDVVKFIGNMTGSVSPIVINNVSNESRKLYFHTHRGHFDFHVRIIKNPA